MRSIICFVLLLVSAISGARPLLHIVSDDWPPYVIVDGRQQGIDVEVSRIVLEKLGYHVRIEFLPWKRAVQMVKTGEADALLDVGYNEERELYFDYPQEPINYSETTLFCKRCKLSLPAELKTISGKQVVVNRGYVYEGEFDESPLVTLVTVDDFEQGMKLISLGRADFYAVNRLVGAYTAHNLGLKDVYPISDNLSEANPIYLAFSKKREHTELAKGFSQALKAFKQSADYRVILHRYGVKP